MPVIHASFKIEKTYPPPVAKVFAAFADSATKQRWYGRGSPQDGAAYQNDFRVGGQEHSRSIMGDNTPFPGAVLSSQALYLDIIDGRRIVTGSNMMMNGTPFSGSLLTFEFEADGDGTRLICTHAGAYFENSDGPEMREHGWNALLDRLGDAL
ncbi:MAG: SRPBCC domain-containing protein [Asticcacaulis sp.]|nr:SRPBCC domain-containing protein [Asticcacaulis sp.]